MATALGTASSVSADTATLPDAADDVSNSSIDIGEVTINNKDRGLVVTIQTLGLSEQKAGGTQVWIDTRQARMGPEFTMVGSTGPETDYYLWRTKGWKIVGSFPPPCALSMRVDYSADTVRWRTGPDCLGDYSRIRVSTEATFSHTDFAPAEHKFGPWVSRG